MMLREGGVVIRLSGVGSGPVSRRNDSLPQGLGLWGDSWRGDGFSWSRGVGRWLAFVGFMVCVVA